MISTNNTLFIGKVLHELEAIGSTNQYALDLLTKSKPSEGTVVITQNQYAGRGQSSNHWESEASKNLTFSLILYPTFLIARQQFYLNQAVSLSVLKTLQFCIPKKCSIKWPNDLYVEDRKITGILIQNALRGSSLQSSVVGIGLNINQEIFTSNAPNPTSIKLETNKEFTLEAVLNYLCQQLEKYYLLLKSGRFQILQQQYQESLYRLNELHLYKRKDGSLCKGTILGVTETGLLRLKTEKKVEQFAFKEIKYLIDN